MWCTSRVHFFVCGVLFGAFALLSFSLAILRLRLFLWVFFLPPFLAFYYWNGDGKKTRRVRINGCVVVFIVASSSICTNTKSL